VVGITGGASGRSWTGQVLEKNKLEGTCPGKKTRAHPSMAVATESFTVQLGAGTEELTALSFIDRRKKPYRRKQWVLVRSLEKMLYGVGLHSRSTGAFSAHLSKCSMDGATLCCEKARVDDETITQAELDAGGALWSRPQTPLPTSSLIVCHPLIRSSFRYDEAAR